MLFNVSEYCSSVGVPVSDFLDISGACFFLPVIFQQYCINFNCFIFWRLERSVLIVFWFVSICHDAYMLLSVQLYGIALDLAQSGRYNFTAVWWENDCGVQRKHRSPFSPKMSWTSSNILAHSLYEVEKHSSSASSYAICYSITESVHICRSSKFLHHYCE